MSQKTDKRGFIGHPLYEAGKAPDPTKKDASLEERKSQTRVQEPPAKRGNPVSEDGRRVSEKLEASVGHPYSARNINPTLGNIPNPNFGVEWYPGVKGVPE